MNSKNFWVLQNLILIGLYAAASFMCINGQSQHWLTWLAAAVLVAHALEIPLAFVVLKSQSPAPLRTVVGTLLFGFTWWLPAKRGIYKVR